MGPDLLKIVIFLLHVHVSLSCGAYRCSGARSLAEEEDFWDYQNPEEWGGDCVNGKNQSPLVLPQFASSPALYQNPCFFEHYIRPEESVVECVQAKFWWSCQAKTEGALGYILVCDQYGNRLKYVATDFHFHTPAEHEITGLDNFDMEIHVTHELVPPENDTDFNYKKELAILAVLFRENENVSNRFLTNMGFDGAVNPPAGGPTDASLQDLINYNMNGSDLYVYQGSLTTPPCTENVNWYIFAEAQNISPSQLAQLRSLYSENSNARPPQDSNGRFEEAIEDSNEGSSAIATSLGVILGIIFSLLFS